MKKRSLVALLPLIAILLSFPSAVSGQTTTFSYTGAVQTYTVPCGVTSVVVDAQGAKGGFGYNSYSRGGYGGRVLCTLAVTPGQVLSIYVGGVGGNATSSIVGTAGYNGGATGYSSNYGGGGGGASDIRIGGTALTDRVIIAGGGGGGGYNYSTTDYDKGGGGGGTTGEKGYGANSNTGSQGGGGGTAAGGGAGSTYTTPNGTIGTSGIGGAGGYYGGGGGGGYWGGGGGAYGGGGGGSSYTDAVLVTSVTHTQGYNTTGNGSVAITPSGGIMATPSSLTFIPTTVGGLSPTMTTTLSCSGLGAGPFTITPPAGFQVSLDGITWSSSAINYTFSGTSFSGVVLYVRFSPSTLGTYSNTIAFGIGSTSCSFNVSGLSAPGCSGTPVAGTAIISPEIGNGTTPFTLSLAGTSVTGGLTYQWQSSILPSGGFTNIAGATNPSYSFTGIATNTRYRALVTCPSYAAGTSSTSSASYLLSFTYTGAVQTYTVPCGISSVLVDMQGAQGGSGYNSYSRGGYGGRTVCSLAVTPGQVLYINVGGAGGNGTSSVPGTGGFNGGAFGYTYGGGSGGASDIRIGGTALSNRVVVAGGGGGAGYSTSSADYDRGGAGGDATGEKGYGSNSNLNSSGGLGGTQASGGIGSTNSAPYAAAGSMGVGGTGGTQGGGGGGGYYGGGGGCTGGGGGGSSYANTDIASSVTFTRGYNNSGNGIVTIIGGSSGLVATTGSLAFGIVTTGSSSSVMTTTLSATSAPPGGSIIITPPSGFQVSLNGTTWSSAPLNYTYGGTSFSGVVLYVRFQPTSAAAYTGVIDIAGGLAFCGINVSGTGAPACSGTPTAGTAWVSPATGGGTTTFTAGLLGTSVVGGLTYQWQSSSSSTSGFTDIVGATNPTYTLPGISVTTYLKAVVTCPSFASVISNTTVATLGSALGYTGTIGRYVVPADVYSVGIVVKGAQGGNSATYNTQGGKGAIMQGNFSVYPGQVLKYIVGQEAADANFAAGGGGGSFVWDSATNAPLIIAGGGGGAGNGISKDASITTMGTEGSYVATGGGGTAGNGGVTPSSLPSTYYAGGGAGWLSNGVNTNYTTCAFTAQGGTRPLEGGAGGAWGGSSSTFVSAGGFGGGGGAQGNCSNLGAGGGGGYSGGGPGVYNGTGYGGGGGGSLNTGSTQSNSVGNTGDGLVTITPLEACVTPISQPTSFSYSSSLFTINGSFVKPTQAPMGYLVLMTDADTPPASPEDGSSYSLGDASLGGVVVAKGGSNSFSVTGITPETKKYFWIYSYNDMCVGGPKYLVTSPLHDSAATQQCSMSGVRTIGSGGDYPTIAAALADANTYGVRGTLALEMMTNYTGETYPINLNGTYPCLSPTNNIVIRPQGTMTITASNSGALFKFDGARYITLDGRVGSMGTTKALTIINTSTSTPVIQFTNDAMYDTLQYCIVKSANITTSTTNSGAVNFTSSTGFSGNDYNTIESCDITAATATMNVGIYSYGASNKENSYNTISNCNIYDYFYATNNNYGVWLNLYNNNWTIKGNRFYQTASRSYTSGYSNGGINVSPGATGTSSGFNILNNVIGFASNTGTGVYTTTSTSSDNFRGISTSVGVTEPTVIYGNTISGLNITESNSATTGGGAMTGIYHTSGSANIDSNIIGATTGNGAITATIQTSGGTVVGISTSASSPSLATPAVVNIRKNKIGSITVNGSSTTIACAVHAIQASQTASIVISDNLIGSTTTANSIWAPTVNTSGSQYVYGINSQITTALATPPVITNNIIANLRGAGTSTANLVAGIVHASGSATVNISANQVYNIAGATANTVYSTQVGVAGIICNPNSTTATATVNGNTVYNISNSNTASVNTHVAGILFGTATDATILGNKIYGITNASTYTGGPTSPPTATGIFIYNAGGVTGNTLTVANNMVTLGTGQTTNTSFTGIMAYSGSTSSYVYRLYHNTVLIEGTAQASAANHTAAFMRGGYNTSNTNTIDVRNNIFSNTRTNTSGTANHYAIANNIGFTVTSTGWSSDYNILNSANTATVGWSGGVNQTFANWKTVTTSDYNSATAATITFANTSVGDLHINMGTTANAVESHGTSLVPVTTDYDNTSRPGPVGSVNGGGFAPDLGADEFDGNPVNNIAPSITYTPLVGSCGTANRTFDATLADPAGVPTTGTLMPRVYYRKNSGTWYSSPGTLTSGTATNGVWTFTVVASDMGGLASGNTVQYFVVAQDNTAYVGSNTSGLIATNVNTISTFPNTAALSYTVNPTLGGPYNIGTGGDYTTLTSAVAAYNAACLTGPVTFNLISTTYPSESFPIQINGNSFASSTNTLTIKPAPGVAATISGPSSPNSIIKLADAKWVIIDGIKSGGANLTLNSTYTSTFANIWVSSNNVTPVTGCRNITLRNLDIVGGTNTSTNYGILSSYNLSSTPTTSAGTDNDSITVQGNNISKCYYGIYLSGSAAVSAGGYDNWIIANNNIGPATYNTSTNIYLYGIYMTNVIGPKITGNTLRNIGLSTTSNTIRAINLSTNVNGAEISGNTIQNVTASYGSDYSSPVSGIYLGSSVQNCSVLRNVIANVENTYASGAGSAAGIMVNTSQYMSNILIANNMISRILAKGASGNSYFPLGIHVYSSTGGVKIYHNSINLFGDYAGNNAASTGSANIMITSSYSNIDVRNNVLSNSLRNINSTSDKGYAIYSSAAAGTFSYIDYNNYYVTGSNVLGYLSGDRTDLFGMQVGFGGNSRSLNVAPTFIDSVNLRLQPLGENLLLQAGTPLAQVTRDIDDTLRDATNPVIGAHEVKVPLCNTVPLTAGSLSPSTPVICSNGSPNIVTVGTTGARNLTYQWLSSVDSATWAEIPYANSRSYSAQTPITTTTFYRLRVGCSLDPARKDSATTKIVVNPSNISGIAEVCAGSVTTLSDTAAGGTWSSSATTIATVGVSTGIVSGVTSGVARITYTITSSGCYTTKIVTVMALPATITGALGVCQGASTTLASLSLGGTWTSGSPSVVTVGAANGIVSGASVGYSNITYTLPSGCRRMVQASVNPNPVMSITPSATASMCIGDVASFKATGHLPGFTLLDENFNSGIGSWLTNNLSGAASSAWQIYTTAYNSVSGDGTPMLLSAPEIDGGGSNILTSPSFSTVGFDSVTLSFNQDLLSSDMDDIEVAVEYSTNGGVSWNLLLDELNVIDNPGTWAASSPQVIKALPNDAVNKPDVKLRWKYNTSFGYYWAIDNVKVTAVLPDPTYTWSTLGSASPLSCMGCDSVYTTPTVPGVNVYSVLATSASGCVSTDGLVTLNVNTPPGAIAGTKVVCENASTTLTNASPGGTWSSGDITKATINNLTGVVTGTGAGTADITYAMSSGCRVFTVVTVNAAPAPLLGIAKACVGFTTSLSTTSTDGTWSSGASTIASVDGSGVVSGASPGVAVISYTNLNNCSAVANVTVNQYPAAITASTFNVCEGQSINLSNASTGGTWTSSNATTASVTIGSGIVTGVAAGGTVPATATISYTLPGGCARTQDITVDPAPLPISGPAAVCQNATISLSSTTPGGSWSMGSSFVASVDGAGNVAGVNPGTTLVMYTLLNGCKATFNVAVNQVPGAIAGDMQVCEGASTTLSNSVSGGTWSSSDPMTAGISGLGVVNAVTAGNTEITYALPTGCRTSAWATVNPQPSAILGTKFMCQGTTTSLSSTPVGGTWTTSTPDIAIVDNGSGVVTGSPVNSGTATITYTLPEGCRVTTQTTVTLLPAAIAGSLTVCEGSTITLTSASAGGTWSASNGNATISAGGIVTGVTAGTTEIVYGFSPACSQSAVVTVNMTPADITGLTEICQNEVTTLSNTTPDGTWIIGSSFIATADATAGVMTGVNAGGTSVTYLLANGCKTTESFVVNQLPAPIIGTMAVCEGSTTTLSSTTPGGTWTAANTHVNIGAGGYVNGVTAGTTEVVYAFSTGCSRSAVVTVNLTPADITGTAELCEGAVTTLASTTPDGSWSTGSTFIASVDAASGAVTANNVGGTSVVYTLPNGCKAAANVVVDQLPAPISGVEKVCEGAEITLSNTVSGGTWVSADPVTADINGMGVVTGHIAGIVNVTYEMSTGCARSAAVTVNALPAAIAGASSVCENATASVTNTSTGGVWSTTAAGIADISAATGTVTGLGTGTATITYSLSTGCRVTADITVMSKPAPITGTAQICQGQITTLESITPGGTWNVDLPGVASVNILGEVSGVTAGYANISYIMPSGCQQTAMVTVKSLPVAYPVGGGGSYCVGGTGANVTLLVSQVGVSYQLYNGPAAVGSAVSGTDAAINFGLQTAPGIYSVEAASTVTGCVNDMFGSATVTIAPVVVPAVTLSVPGGTTICGGSAATYNATPVNGGTLPAYAWEVNSAPVVGATSASYSYVPANGDIVKVTLTSNAACASTGSFVDVVTMVVNTPVTPLASISGPSSVCKGDPATMTVTPTSGGISPSLQWYVNGAGVPAATNSTYTFVPNAGDYIYCTMATSIACNSAPIVNSNTIALLTNPVFLPTVGISVSPGVSVVSGTPVTFSTIVSGAGAAPVYQWFINGSPVAGETNTSFSSSTLHNNDSVTCRVTATETCGHGTFNSTLMTVKPTAGTIVVNGRNSDLRLVPNPNTGIFTINGHMATQDNETVALEITNVLGQTVYTGSLIARSGYVNGQVKLPGDLANGMYLVSMKSAGEQQVLRFVLEQ